MNDAMTSSRPYFIRGIYDWILDNGLTPYIVIDAGEEGVQVPTEYVEEGRIVLNISPAACRGLHLENDRVVFSARFSGVSKQVFAPPSAVIAVYASENGRGIVFETDNLMDDGGDAVAPPPIRIPSPKSKKKPHLKIVE